MSTVKSQKYQFAEQKALIPIEYNFLLLNNLCEYAKTNLKAYFALKNLV